MFILAFECFSVIQQALLVSSELCVYGGQIYVFLNLFIVYFSATPSSLWDVSSLTRDQTRAHSSESTKS